MTVGDDAFICYVLKHSLSEHAEPTPAPSKPAPSKPAPGGHGILGGLSGIKDLPIIGGLPVIGSRPPFEGLLPDLPRIGTFERKSFLSFKVNPLGIPLVDAGADPRRGAGYLNILVSSHKTYSDPSFLTVFTGFDQVEYWKCG
jgi:hypothetical protein